MASSKTAIWSRRKILDILRGVHVLRDADHEPTRVFPLQRQHMASYQQSYDTPLSPTDFHAILCDRIERATRRIYLASLYVGPAVDSKIYRQEARLLQALQSVTQNNPYLHVKILMDKCRGLRPVPIQSTNDADENKTITSAEAC